MARIGYFAVVVVVIGSVVFGLDWVPAPMSPMPDVHYTGPVALAPPAISITSSPATQVMPATPVPPVEQTAVAEPPAPPAVEPPPGCNVTACAAAYHSFLSADCSYQPSNGPRRRCTKK